MGIKDWVRSRSKSRSRTSGEINRTLSKSQAKESYSAPSTGQNSDYPIPQPSTQDGSPLSARAQYSSIPSTYGSSDNNTSYGAATAARSASKLTGNNVPARKSSKSYRQHRPEGTYPAPGTALSTDNTTSAPPQLPTQSFAESGSNAMGAAGDFANTDGASKSSTQHHTLKHQPDISNMSREMDMHAQSTARDSGGLASNRAVDKALPVPTELQPAPWSGAKTVDLQQPLNYGNGTSALEVNQLADKVAPMSLVDNPKNTTVPSGRPLPVTMNTADIELTPFATPMFEASTLDAVNPFSQAEVHSGQQHAYKSNAPVVSRSSQPPDLRGIVDLTNTEDTNVITKVAPAVVHETVLPEVHHIREERITREIHTHETYHRILPIIDVEVLPARHFIPSTSDPSSGAYEEVPAEALPQSTIDRHNNRHWVIAETVSRGANEPLPGPRKFTAKQFPGTDGDYKQWTGEDGVVRTQTTWVHPPTVDEELKRQGLTQPVHIP